jgi:hypothetical protein
MARMTDEEADYWDDYYTKNPPKVSGDGKNGFFVKHKGSIVILDDLSATYFAPAPKVPIRPRRKLSENWCGRKSPPVWNRLRLKNNRNLTAKAKTTTHLQVRPH